MAKLTRANIAYDLNVSPHKTVVKYDACDITFVFSSELYKNKFIEKRESNRLYISDLLTKRYGFRICNDILSDLKLYLTIEKRGFLIYKGLVKVECLNDIILDGHQMIFKN